MKCLLWIVGVMLLSAAARAESLPPVVFAHGLGISGEAYELLGGLRSFFEGRRRPFLIARTPVRGSIEERGTVLKREIARLVPGQGKFYLVGHSMGGLDARWALQDRTISARVISLTTLSTPHHGSALADYVVRHVDRLDPVLKRALNRVFGGDLRAARQMTTDSMERVFNPSMPDAPGVEYYSMGFYIPTPVSWYSRVPWIWAAHRIQQNAGFARNDGMVSVESSRWGHELGVMEGDHYSETSPLPLRGGPSYLEVFGRVLDNIERREAAVGAGF